MKTILRLNKVNCGPDDVLVQKIVDNSGRIYKVYRTYYFGLVLPLKPQKKEPLQ